MSTTKEHVYAVQHIFNSGRVTDDKRIPNKLVSHILNSTRNLLVKRKLDRRRPISENTYQRICVLLEPHTYHDCSCIPDRFIDCQILRSKCKLPAELVYSNGSTLMVKYADGRIMSRTTITTNRDSQYSLSQTDTKNIKDGWFIESGYLYVLSPNNLKLVIVKMILEDPSDVNEFCGDCLEEDVSDNTTNCYDEWDGEFPIDADLVVPMYDLTIEQLAKMYKFPVDNENNARNTEIINDAE